MIYVLLVEYSTRYNEILVSLAMKKINFFIKKMVMVD